MFLFGTPFFLPLPRLPAAFGPRRFPYFRGNIIFIHRLRPFQGALIKRQREVLGGFPSVIGGGQQQDKLTRADCLEEQYLNLSIQLLILQPCRFFVPIKISICNHTSRQHRLRPFTA